MPNATAATPQPAKTLTPAEAEALTQAFSYNAPTLQQTALYNRINQGSLVFARCVMENCPPGANRSAAMQLIQSARMTANSAIALEAVTVPW